MRSINGKALGPVWLRVQQILVTLSVNTRLICCMLRHYAADYRAFAPTVRVPRWASEAVGVDFVRSLGLESG